MIGLSRTAATLAIALATWLPLPAQSARSSGTPAASPARARTERAVPFHVGERLTYDVSWSSFVIAGTATATVTEKRTDHSRTAYYIVAEGRPTSLVASLYRFYYKMDTAVDAFTLLPERGSIYSEEGSRRRYRITEFHRATHKASFEVRTTTTVTSEFAIPADAQDALSAVYVLRAVPLKAGDRMTMPVSDNGSMYRVSVDVHAPEQVRTPAGSVRAWKVVPTVTDAANRPVGRNMAMWLSDDARRLPVRFQAEVPVGTFDLVLRDAR